MPRYSRNDWLEQGLNLLVQSGVEALTIDRMCQHLQVTKGSFYHHFLNREGFLEALLQYWETTYTSQFIEFSQAGETPQERLKRLHQLVIDTHNSAETAIRAWAQVDPLARVYQERVDQRRIEYLYHLHVELIQDETRARVLANMVYAVLIGAQEILPPLSREVLQQIYELIEENLR